MRAFLLKDGVRFRDGPWIASGHSGQSEYISTTQIPTMGMERVIDKDFYENSLRVSDAAWHSDEPKSDWIG